MFVVTLKYLVPREQVLPYIEEHYAFLDKFYDSGHFLASGPKHEKDGGVILAKAETYCEIEKILAQDPFWKHELADYQITSFEPTRQAERFSI